MIHGPLGLFHVIASFVAMITGTLVLAKQKGTRSHRIIGYIYFVSMVLLNFSSFGLYNLFGSWGIFHYGAVASLFTVVNGMIPAIRKTPNWIHKHLAWMYWSVVSLYAAFFSETFARIPSTPFFGMVAIATALTMLAGAYYFKKYRRKWAKLN